VPTENSPKPVCEYAQDIDPWEQQPGESGLWYARFEFYLNMPEHSRKMSRAYKHWGETDNDQKESVGIGRTFRNYKRIPGSWVENSAFWRWRDRAILKDREDRFSRRRRQSERQALLEDEEWAASEALIKRAKEMIEYPMVTQTATEGGQVITIRPQNWSAADAARYMVVASDLARRAVGAVEAIEPLAALQVLVNEGWIPESVLQVAGEELLHLPERIKAAFDAIESDRITDRDEVLVEETDGDE